jgi:hypothetical protein
MESAVAGLLKIQRANPEHEAAIQAAVQVMTDQSFTIDALSKALAEVRGQLKALLGDLEVDEESQSAIEVIQGGILTILELLEVNGGTSEQSGGASSTSSSTASPSSSSSSGTHPASSTPQTPPLRASRNGSELKSQLTEVYRLANRDKTEAAREKLAEIPDGKELHIRSIDNAAKAMEDLLLQRGGLSSAHRTLGQLFDRPIVRTIMSDYLKENAPSSDRDTIAAMVESIKVFFTGAMATRGRRTDLNRNVFYAAAAAVIPQDVRENRQMRAVMRLTGSRFDAVRKAIKFREKMDDGHRGWRLLKTVRHFDGVDFTLLDRWLHSAEASTEDNETKRQIHVKMRACASGAEEEAFKGSEAAKTGTWMQPKRRYHHAERERESLAEPIKISKL